MSTHRTAYSRIALTVFSALAIAFLAPSVWSKAYADDSILFDDSENGAALLDSVNATYSVDEPTASVESLAQYGGEGPGLVDASDAVAAPDTISGMGFAPTEILIVTPDFSGSDGVYLSSPAADSGDLIIYPE